MARKSVRKALLIIYILLNLSLKMRVCILVET